MKVGFEGIGQELATFLAEDGLKSGQVCTVTGSGTVGTCEAGKRFCGVALHAGDGKAAVQLRGFVTAAYTGDSAPDLGFTALTADGNGGVTVGGSETYLVVQVDSATNTVGFWL
jgi:hypothetical protein